MHPSTKRSGRISFILLAAICSVAFIAVLFSFGGDTPGAASSEFLTALATGDAKTLAKRSIIRDLNEEQRQKAWEESLKYSRSFLFHWALGPISADNEQASVKLEFTRNLYSPTAYAEHFELFLVKKPDGWKVDVPQLSREMYPYLPQ
jgi:hypothetical protein